ncbi:MAG: hydroxymethylpyrimidine/phosphomethylpyrimidine kinase, partial [Candidatus Thioglobus sp.]|nr:hydroxymethylpyrimidine/phosphomethylpyrimidine kinase [Candidatus Thioglobus sp.]
SVKSTQEVDSKLIAEQFNHLKTDVTFSVAKIGLLSSKKQIEVLTNLLSECDDVTIVLDPIVKSTAKDKLLDSQTLEVLKTKLLPLVDVITPNVDELQALSPNKNEQQAVESLPCEWVLLTTTDSSNDEIEHRLYHHAELLERYTYTKLPGDYHGSGCTLASSIAGLLALGVETRIACKRALDYTYQTLLNAKSIGKMQHHPNRQKP